jgi:signal transduction histidine kinase
MKSTEPTELVALRKALDQKSLNYSQILELATKLATNEPNRLRFTTDAGIISRLGKELVARQETAVSELVKNAYDADGTTVQVVFVNARRPGGELLVIDDGLGMTREELIDGFMRLASTMKIDAPLSSRFKRRRAGRKGIGRFATQRLGSTLELTTQTLASEKAIKLTVNWDKFTRDHDLMSITSSVAEIAKQKPEGTTLRIRALRDGWTDAQISRVYRYVSDLVQPYPLQKPANRKDKDIDPGFRATFYRRVAGKNEEVASADRMVLDYAVGVVTASVNSKGTASWQLVSERYGLDERSSLRSGKNQQLIRFKYLRNVRLKAHYFIWDPSLIPRQQNKKLKELANEQGGIRLYRNGFRVLPYGEPGNDWLGFDELYRRRSILVPLSNINWFGFVEITDPEGTTFEETSSREGIADNPAYRELINFASQPLIEAAQRVASARNRKLTAGQRRASAPSEPSLRRIASDLEAISKRVRQASQKAAIRSAAQSVLNVGKALLEENSTLRVLSSLGLTITIFAHEVRNQIFSLRQLAAQGADRSLSDVEQRNMISEMEQRLKVLQAYTAYFDKTISASIRREVEEQPLTTVLFEFIDQFKPVIERRGAEFVGEDEIEEGLITKPMHSSEWASILSNLLTNSLKAIKRGRRRSSGHVLIRAWQADGKIIVEFADDGDGIPKKIQSRIFEPFFTTTGAADVVEDELVGMGLGLTIVRDILTSYGGTIETTKAPRGYSTCFRIEIAAASKERS